MSMTLAGFTVFPTVVLRMSCIAGPRQFGTEDQGWVAHFLYSALQQRPIVIYGDGRQVRDVLAVHDLVRAIDLLWGSQTSHGWPDLQHRRRYPEHHVTAGIDRHIEKLTGQKLEITSAESRPGDQLVYTH